MKAMKNANIFRALKEREKAIDPEALLHVMKAASDIQRETYNAVKHIIPRDDRDRMSYEISQCQLFISLLELDIHKHQRETFRDL